ncbi:hypothetical protein AGLY_015753 [Aphis glycines]|uniref:Integrase catalytic domain-containing protein n=1 Tax=Aphis glycines TaxID=307491 RepID=A0A6G0T0I8_APHGL|nr:hypothetical protein AGLY_015753 [Aphis glycines]
MSNMAIYRLQNIAIRLKKSGKKKEESVEKIIYTVTARDSERSDECIDFTMIITSRNNAPISNYGGGFRCKSEYPWCVIQFEFIQNMSKLRKFASNFVVGKSKLAIVTRTNTSLAHHHRRWYNNVVVVTIIRNLMTYQPPAKFSAYEISKNKLDLIKRETQNDLVYKKLSEVIQSGRPENKNSIDEIIKPYWSFKENLCVIDNLLFKNKMVDYYSKFIEIAYLTSGFISTSVIQHLKSMFARFEISFSIVSDNGPSFNSLELKQFMSEWDIELITSSPNYAQSNGLAEKSIQSIKKLLNKYKETLMHNRNSSKGNLCSLSQLLMSKSIRTKLPVPIDNLKPN